VIHMVYFVTLMLNVVPNKQGVSEHLSPRTLITGRKFDFATMPKVLFGAYVEASTDADLTNDMKSRTHPCIGLGPSGNMQGSLKCFDIQTGKVVTRRTINRISGKSMLENKKLPDREIWYQFLRRIPISNRTIAYDIVNRDSNEKQVGQVDDNNVM